MSLKSLLFAKRYYFLIHAYNLLANFMCVCVCMLASYLLKPLPTPTLFTLTKGTTEIMNDKPFF